MADKKPDKGKGGDKPKPAGGGDLSIEAKLGLAAAVAAMLFFIILPALGTFFGVSKSDILPSDLGERISSGFESFIAAISYVSIFLSLVFMCGIIYAKTMYAEVKKKMSEASEPKKQEATIYTQNLVASGPDPRWKDIEGLMQSGNPADWRVAILEADIMLDDMLTQMGYKGDSIGEKMKQIDRAHFGTLNEAWQAHKVRNTIAHEGASFKLGRSDADDVIALYKKVFDEFYFV